MNELAPVLATSDLSGEQPAVHWASYAWCRPLPVSTSVPSKLRWCESHSRIAGISTPVPVGAVALSWRVWRCQDRYPGRDRRALFTVEFPGDRGLRLAPDTADCIIEAWGPDRVTCRPRRSARSVSVFADVPEAAATTTLQIALEPAPLIDLLVGLLEEVIYTVDVFGLVPVHVHLVEGEAGGLAGDFEVVTVDVVGRARPKGRVVPRPRDR